MVVVAEKAAITLKQTGRLTVIVLAFGSLHKRSGRAATVAILASTRIIYVLFTPLLF